MNSMQKKKTPKAKRTRRIILTKVEMKYFDTLSVANSIGSGATLFQLSTVPQGVAQTQRVGDFIKPLKLIFNFSLYTVNADIITTIRLIFFRWVPSTALVLPVLADILEAPASSNVLSHFNYQLQQNYSVLSDRQFQAAGIVTSPCNSSNFGGTGLEIPLGSNPELEFNLGATTSTNHLYLLAISDSALAPFPLLNFSSRLYYEDTIRESQRVIVK
jgi:hypothetical protein